MQFGLWFEPEMINLDSDVARAHPEWVMATGQPDCRCVSRYQQVINLGIPECYAFIRDAILAILDEYKISYIKWDHNRDLIDAGTQPSRTAGRARADAGLLPAPRRDQGRRTPTLEIESCASGGGRVDLGVLARTDRVWVSDCIDPLERQQIARWTTQLIPPELMGSHIASGRSHTTGRVHDLDFRAATAIFGHLGIEWDLTKTTDDDRRGARAPGSRLFKRASTPAARRRPGALGLPRRDADGRWRRRPRPTRGHLLLGLGRSIRGRVLGRMRLPGLDPERHYRYRPVIGGHRSGCSRSMVARSSCLRASRDVFSHKSRDRLDTVAEGMVLTSAAMGPWPDDTLTEPGAVAPCIRGRAVCHR